MNQQGPRIRIIAAPGAGLLERIAYSVLGLLVLVAAFFFIGIALVAGALLALVVLARWWWLRRRLRRAKADSFVEGEYRVVEAGVAEAAIADERQPRQ